MNFLANIKKIGATLALCLCLTPLTQAATINRPALEDFLRAQETTQKQDKIQYEVKATLFSPLGVGNFVMDGNILKDPVDKKTNQQEAHADGRGHAELALLTGYKFRSPDYSYYAAAENNLLVQYVKTGNTWKKALTPVSLTVQPKEKHDYKTLRKRVLEAQVTADSPSERTIKLTLDAKEIFKAQEKKDGKVPAKKSKEDKEWDAILDQIRELSYMATIDKESNRLTSVSLDLTPILRTTGLSALSAAQNQMKLTPEQRQMAEALISTSSLGLTVNLKYDPKKAPKFPEGAKKAKEVKISELFK